MAIEFIFDGDPRYFVSRWRGVIDDVQMLDRFAALADCEGWQPEMNEMADLSAAELGAVTGTGLRRLAHQVDRLMRSHGVTRCRTAEYGPQPLQFGIARMYSVFTEALIEDVRVFRDYDDALSWVREEDLAAGGPRMS